MRTNEDGVPRASRRVPTYGRASGRNARATEWSGPYPD
jgi:hypothetical protein